MTITHRINWFEIPVTDLDRAQRFYEAVTGEPLRREPFGGPGEAMAVFPAAQPESVHGALQLSAHSRPSADGTRVYLNAGPRLADWLARVEPAGGRIVVPRTELPAGMGCFAQILDTEGNCVGLHAPA